MNALLTMLFVISDIQNMGFYGWNYTPLTPSIDYEVCNTMREFPAMVLSLETVGETDLCPVGFYYKDILEVGYDAKTVIHIF